jgi:hypothetical protein
VVTPAIGVSGKDEMDLPKAGNTYVEERRGIAAVYGYAADRAQIWRETDTGDVGI